MAIYQDTLCVRECFLFDPDGDYLDPPLQGYRAAKKETDNEQLRREVEELRRRLGEKE
jgi:hypothetical protein